ncbi:MAG: DUF4197 domain-containing protein [Methylococcales bacterium]|nr:DUF4197 domain-containing protein [Methylococcales bacterium]
MLKTKLNLTTVALTLFISQSVQADWMDAAKNVVNKAAENSGSEIAQSALSNSDVVSGLKEALANGVKSAINSLGTSGGFSNSPVKIAIPDSLSTIATTVRTLGQGHYVDSLESTMNQAAEKAVPEAAEILSDAIRQMSVTDAMSILNGSDDAATQYFRKISESSLMERFKPIVTQATNSAGVTASYKNLTSQASPLLGGIMDKSSLDIDQYVTDKSLDGLFKYIAEEEKSIRSNPAARTTDLLKKVFAN